MSGRFAFDGPAGTLTVTDTVRSADAHRLTWTFPLPPGARAEAGRDGTIAQVGGARLTIAGEGLDFTVEDGWYAPAYGVREPAPFVHARRAGRAGEDVQRITLSAARTAAQ